MQRKLAQFLLWLGLFGLFLSFAASSSGSPPANLLLGSLLMLFVAWRILRKPRERFEPSKRFRTLRRLGLIDKGPEAPHKD